MDGKFSVSEFTTNGVTLKHPSAHLGRGGRVEHREGTRESRGSDTPESRVKSGHEEPSSPTKYDLENKDLTLCQEPCSVLKLFIPRSSHLFPYSFPRGVVLTKASY